VTSFLQHWPLARKKHQLYPMLRTLAFESFDFSGYDLVISSSSAEAKGIITSSETLHLSYIHTPTRYYWSGYEDYLSSPGLGIFNPLAKMVLPRVVKKMRHWDYAAAQRPDLLIANSMTVQARIKKYYKRESVVINPPVDTARFKNSTKPEKEGYYLVVSRLIPYKRVDLAVRACTRLGKKLLVVGSGSELASLKSIAGPSVSFTGSLSDAETTTRFKKCKAFIFTANEDFGITPVEAMSAGRPVVAFGKGGSSETVVDGVTGVFFDSQTVDSLEKAIIKFEKASFDTGKIVARAADFSKENFKSNINMQIKQIIND
jgi:glycosyltransferase involved in cell wall biosynthesis